MKIRSITAFTALETPLTARILRSLGSTLKTVRQALIDEGYEVQSTRIAIQPFPEAFADPDPANIIEFAQNLEEHASVNEIDYVSLGPVRLGQAAEFVDAIFEILSNTETVFAAVEIANREDGLSLSRIRLAAELVRRVAAISPDGFANLRLAALSHVPPGAPFFPAAYHDGGPPSIAVATESADLALNAMLSAGSFGDARDILIRSIEGEAIRIENQVADVLEGGNIGFGGIDFTMAPYPAADRSIGAALEGMGLPALGEPGSLFAAAFITEAIGRAEFTSAGFNGLMLPILEDSVLAERSADGLISVNDLLTYSAVCGTGLDTIPLPGDTAVEVMAAVLMDVSAMALRLDKPLTARLMPLPGKAAGDEVNIDFEYFASSRVMKVLKGNQARFSRFFKGDETLKFRPNG